MEHVSEVELQLLRQAQINLNNLRSSLKRAEQVFNSALTVVWEAHDMVSGVDEVDLDTGEIHRAEERNPPSS